MQFLPKYKTGIPNAVAFIKPDLDSVGCACLLFWDSWSHWSEVDFVHLSDRADEALLGDHRVLCVECGGEGRVREWNFDHHAPHGPSACATEQAYSAIGSPEWLGTFCRYVSAVDRGLSVSSSKAADVTLSSLFSGMLCLETDPVMQFKRGLELLREVLLHPKNRQSPWALADLSPAMTAFLVAKRDLARQVAMQSSKVVTRCRAPLVVMSLESALPGAHGLMRDLGADLSVAVDLRLKGHVSISCRPGLGVLMQGILGELLALEPGWGGPAAGTVISSPRGLGTGLSLQSILEIVSRSARHFSQAHGQ